MGRPAFALLVVLLLAVAARADGERALRNTAPGVNYVGSAVCAACHEQIYRKFRQTPMGRSMRVGSDPVLLKLASKPVSVAGSQSNRRFDVFRQNDSVYQSESEAGTFQSSFKMEYAVGSGVNGYTYLVRRGDYLFQAPLSYYSRAGKWELSPGYEFADYGFSRAVPEACIVCHSGRPQPVAGQDGRYRDPPFLELAIGCENCHGPGQLHVTEIGKGLKSAGSIVNPAKLAARMAEDICMNCHQRGDTRVLQPGKDYLDFRPGTYLNDTLAIFKLSSGEDADLLEHHSAMKASRCFTASGGRLSCLTCHDPHQSPAGGGGIAWYRSKCLSCHTDRSCKLPIPARQAQGNDCTACHMPKRAAGPISHSALTNHRIPATAGQPDGSGAPPTELIHINQPPGGAALPRVTLLKAYGELMDRQPQFRQRYLELLEVLGGETPNDAFVQAALGRKSLQDPLPEAASRAREQLARAIELGFHAYTVYADLSDAMERLGRLDESARVLADGVTLHPYSPVLYKMLAMRYIGLKQYARAKETMQRYVELFPEDAFMRGLLEKATKQN
jgi:hypothetical protein